MSSMKDSGVAWIGKIPKKWEVTKVKYYFEVINGSTPDSNNFDYWDGEINWITPADMSDFGAISKGENNITGKGYNSCGTTILPSGSIVISCRAPIGKINYALNKLCTNQGCKSLLRIGNNRFFFYLLYTAKEELLLLGRGTTFLELSTYDLKMLDVITPLTAEQQAIADFLDSQCSKIDSIIEDIEKEIDILERYKKSLITETVTKGLDKNVPMKDSGVEWIGDVPSHWEIKKLKYFLTANDDLRVGPFGSSLTNSDFVTEGIAVYNQRSVLDNQFDEMDTFISREKFKELRSFEVAVGDILLTTRGTIGKVAIVPQDSPLGILHPCLIRFRTNKSAIIDKLLVLIFNETTFIKDQLVLMSNSTTIDVIYSYSLKEVLLPVIPKDEQSRIYEFLNEKCLKINSIIATKNKQLETIKKHKQSLIYEYVTGKKRVKSFEGE